MLTINEYPEGESYSIDDLIHTRGIPFQINRFIEISRLEEDVPAVKHANIISEKFLLCFGGNVEVKTVTKNNNNFVEETHVLVEGDFLYIPPMIWSEQTHNNNAIVHMLYSNKYDEEDYVEDYEDFKQL